MKKNEAGFSYMDVLIAVTILLVGVMALAAAVTGAVIRSYEGEQRLVAKQLAASTLESIFSARDIDVLGWNSIGNVGSNPDPDTGIGRGVFLSGQQQVMTGAGPDNVVGTNDDNGTAQIGFNRQITVVDVCDPDRPSPICPGRGTYPIMMRQVNVTIFYRVGNLQRQETASTVITNY